MWMMIMATAASGQVVGDPRSIIMLKLLPARHIYRKEDFITNHILAAAVTAFKAD